MRIDCQPAIKGVRPDDPVGYADEPGNFHIGGAGQMPRTGIPLLRPEHEYEFCFYADSKYEGGSYDVEVTMTSTDRFTGSSVQIDPEDLDRTTRNMRRFFSDRCFLMPRIPIPAGEHFRSLRMLWPPRDRNNDDGAAPSRSPLVNTQS
ncbi:MULTISPECIES: hypothetical protein [unclassified Bradyrhizobium]|uniref:hypothetical protein n=1 Tax=unclassified Bradyrhizobium TaxID=2631580 RepID=UPI0029162063|nr:MULTISPECIES: hypothetical protein [unclassified Bradyrhizobium]